MQDSTTVKISLKLPKTCFKTSLRGIRVAAVEQPVTN
jgi:hypothetical protein